MQVTSIFCAQYIPALDLLNQVNEIEIPQTLSLDRAATVNGYGYIFYKTSPLAERFIQDADFGKRFLEIGAGFSNVTGQCLKRNVLEYIANDISLDHLKILTHRLKKQFGSDAEQYLKNLLMLPANAPFELPEKSDHYNAILMERVLHFFTPAQADYFFEWCYTSLTRDGRLYILTISPYSSMYSSKLLTEYKTNKINGILYPGFINKRPYLTLDVKDNPQYVVPMQTLFFTLEDLKARLIEKGFIIENVMTLRLPHFNYPEWMSTSEEECDLIGIIARK